MTALATLERLQGLGLDPMDLAWQQMLRILADMASGGGHGDASEYLLGEADARLDALGVCWCGGRDAACGCARP